jgi:hypothetical protein
MRKVAAVAVAGALLATAPVAVASAEPSPMMRTKPCKDRVVKWIKQAGFKGANVRVAWAIAQRESNGNPNENTMPDLGLMQLNTTAWQGTKYWPANVYDPVQNLTAVRRMVKDMGWQPWGLRVRNGQVSYDFSSYGSWSSWQHAHWIVIPFEKYYAQFPKACR